MTEPLEAQFLRITPKGKALVHCPYCGHQHEHERFTYGNTEHRAPGCGIYAPVNRDQRQAGYTFTIPPNKYTTRTENKK
ncbi:hypothetical protein [Cryobacterium sp. CG_9.6]|uniref:hypothetical protein n=1 Tax=Cryobacterium sp. CG_9.6 TaxID=2760710 RepID=UPI00247698DF|nr:hypothetical protein [Cryobacterium sp. CG_9.6]MDH6237048.1 hypothetical protein [Cryobacterium sp. CG_9.6]